MLSGRWMRRADVGPVGTSSGDPVAMVVRWCRLVCGTRDGDCLVRCFAIAANDSGRSSGTTGEGIGEESGRNFGEGFGHDFSQDLGEGFAAGCLGGSGPPDVVAHGCGPRWGIRVDGLPRVDGRARIVLCLVCGSARCESRSVVVRRAESAGEERGEFRAGRRRVGGFKNRARCAGGRYARSGRWRSGRGRCLNHAWRPRRAAPSQYRP